MSQHLFASETGASNKSDLDANFSELYDLRNLVTTPSFTAPTPKATLNSSGQWGFGSGTPAYRIHAFVSSGDGVAVDGAAGGNRNVLFLSGGSLRWVIAANSAAESGSNVGSNLSLFRYDDTGSFLATAAVFDRAAGHFYPGTDNAQSLGKSSNRWSVVYSGTGTINTSDAREKTSVQALTTAEIAAAKALAAEIGSFQWLSSVQAKGADARTHIGLTVQRAVEIMTGQGLDPMAYGFVCHDSWEESTDDDGNVIPAGDRYGFRTDELLLFVARGFDARLRALEGG